MSKYSAYPGTSEAEMQTVLNYLSFIVETETEGGQSLLEDHDYLSLPSSSEPSKNLRLIAQEGAARIGW